MRTLKGVCVGAGYFSDFQYEAWNRIPEVNITAFCNRNQNRAKRIQDEFGVRMWYTDYVEMLEKERPDFVDIITPPGTQSQPMVTGIKKRRVVAGGGDPGRLELRQAADLRETREVEGEATAQGEDAAGRRARAVGEDLVADHREAMRGAEPLERAALRGGEEPAGGVRGRDHHHRAGAVRRGAVMANGTVDAVRRGVGRSGCSGGPKPAGYVRWQANPGTSGM